MNICEALLCVCVYVRVLSVCYRKAITGAGSLLHCVLFYSVSFIVPGCSQYCLINLQVDRVVLNRGCPSMMGGERRREEKMSREGETESNLSIFSSPVVVFWHVKEEAFYDWIS